MFALPSLAGDGALNVLSKILIEKGDNNSYRLNLFFDEKFEGRAFIQNKDNGDYFVFIPDTMMNEKNVKLIYKDKHDRADIKLNIEEKPFIKENMHSNYVRLSVKTTGNSSIRLIAKTMEEKIAAGSISDMNFSSLLILILLAVAAFMTANVIKAAKTAKNNTCYTTFPSSYLNSPKSYIANTETPVINKPALPKVNIRKTLKSADSDSFSCFDIPLVNDIPHESFGFKSEQKETSGLVKEKISKSKQTNPIKTTNTEDASELALPIVEDLQPEKQEEKQKNRPELLSELHISPDKGFYLTTINDIFALFGFVGDKVFLLKKFSDLTQINLQARFYDRNQNNDMYIVRLDTYKAMIEISDWGMKELAVL